MTLIFFGRHLLFIVLKKFTGRSGFFYYKKSTRGHYDSSYNDDTYNDNPYNDNTYNDNTYNDDTYNDNPYNDNTYNSSYLKF